MQRSDKGADLESEGAGLDAGGVLFLARVCLKRCVPRVLKSRRVRNTQVTVVPVIIKPWMKLTPGPARLSVQRSGKVSVRESEGVGLDGRRALYWFAAPPSSYRIYALRTPYNGQQRVSTGSDVAFGSNGGKVDKPRHSVLQKLAKEDPW